MTLSSPNPLQETPSPKQATVSSTTNTPPPPSTLERLKGDARPKGFVFLSKQQAWRKPGIGYLAALCIPAMAMVGTSLVLHIWPAINLQNLPYNLAIIAVAFFWGFGPGLFSTLTSTILLDYTSFLFSEGTPFSLPSLLLQSLRLIILGAVISLVVSRIEREREQAARQARELDTILTTIADGLFVYDSKGQLIRTNPTAKNFNPNTLQEGYAEQPYPSRFAAVQLQDSQGNILTGENLPTSRVLRGEVLTGERAVDVSFHVESTATRLFNTSGAPIRGEGGEIQGAVMVLRDITERWQIDKENQLRAQQLNALIESVPDAILVFDKAGKISHMNAGARQLLPRYMASTSEEVARRVAQIKPTDIYGVELTHEALPTTRLLRGEILTGERAVDVCVRTFAGETLWLNIAGAPLYDEENQVSGAVAVIRDYTAQHQQARRTQTALNALLQFAEALVQSDEIQGTSYTEQERVEPTTNLVARHLAALIAQVLDYQQVGITAFSTTPEEPYAAAAYGLAPAEEEIWRERRPGTTMRDWLIGTPEGSKLQTGEPVVIDTNQPPFTGLSAIYKACNFLLVPMQIKEHQVGIVTLVAQNEPYRYPEDEIALARALAQLAALTLERAQLFQERTQAQATVLALRETNRLMDEFIGIAGHELRTPLTTVKGSVQIALRQIARVLQQEADLPAAVVTTLTTTRSHLIRGERQIGMQNRLISDLLDVARIHSNRLELIPELCDLMVLVRECVEDQHYLTPNRTIHLLLAKESEEQLVMADTNRVRQVISNYLSNALKYSSADKPVEICLERSGVFVCVSVHDQGPGLSPEEQQRVWERFYRVPTIEVKSGSGIGLGLGLHISKMIIERLGGQVGIKSTPGEGSTFWFTLPLAEAEPRVESSST